MGNEEKRPNILFIMSDQHRFCDTGYAGNKDVETPNLDQLSQDGACFTTAYSNCPLCVPARGSLLTAQHALRHGAAANDIPIHADATSIAHILNDAGYETAYIGKWHLGGIPRDKYITEENRLGFQYWNGCNCNHMYNQGYYDDNFNVRHKIEGYEPIAQTTLALDFLESRKNSQQPYALWLCVGTPHDPYFILPEGELEYFENKKLDLRENVDIEHMKEKPFNEASILKCYAGYYGHIRQLDLQIGRIIQWLKDNRKYEDTILVYTSDHGDMLGSHGFLNKQLWYDESARVPLLISWPKKIPPGKRMQPISLVDIAPTLLGIIGLTFNNKVDGKDLSDVVFHEAAQGQDYVYYYSYVPCHQASNREVRSWRAVTDGKYMYAEEENQNSICMYNMGNDKFQIKDIKDDASYADVKKRLKEALDVEVNKNDGYSPWETLLEKSSLMEAWNESEAYFSLLFKQYYELIKKANCNIQKI